MSKQVTPSQMKRVAFVVAAVLSVAGGSVALAASQDSQLVNFSVTNISQIDVAAGPVSLSIVAPTAGSQPSPATATSSYDITTNASANGKKITAALDSDTPAGLTLSVDVAAPTASGTSQGSKALSSVATDVVLGLQGAAQTNVGISYTLTATVDTAAVSTSRSVTYTIVDL